MSDKAREAGFEALYPGGTHRQLEANEPDFARFNAAIDAYLAALGETHAIVPREATDAMIDATQDCDVNPSRIDDGRGATDVEEVKAMVGEIYHAMLSAAETK